MYNFEIWYAILAAGKYNLFNKNKDDFEVVDAYKKWSF